MRTMHSFKSTPLNYRRRLFSTVAIFAITITFCLTSRAAIPIVTTRGSVFDPIEVDINTGDKVEWDQNDVTEHTVTSDATLDDGITPLFNSGDLETDESFTYTFNT